MAAKSELQIVINADDKASQKIGKVRKAFQRLGKAAKVAKKALKVASVGIAAVGTSMAATVMTAAKFEKGMREVNTLVNLGDKEFKGLTDQMLELSKQTGVATTQLTGGLYQAISAGVPADNALDFMTIASKAAIGGVTEVETAIDGLTTVINAFGLEASDAEAVSDVMFTTVKLGKTTMSELSAAMFQAAPLAASLGLSIEDVAGSVATLTKSGVPTTVAMTQIRAAMVALTKPSAAMEELYAKMGVATGKAALETFGFQGTLEKLNEVTGGSETALVKAMGRVEGFSAVLGLTGKNAAVARADLDEMSKAGGATQTAFEEMNKSFDTTFGILKNQLSVQLQKTGLRLIPKLIPKIQRLSGAYDEWTELGDMVRRAWSWFREEGDFIGALDELHDKYPKVTKKLVAFYLKAKDIKRIALILVDRFRALVQEGSPLRETLAGLAATGTEWIEDLVTHVGNLRDWFLEVLPAIQEFGQGLLDVVVPAVLDAWTKLADLLLRLEAKRFEMMTTALGTLSSMFTERVVPALKGAWEFLKILGAVIVDTIKPAIDEFMDALAPAQEQLAGLSDEFAALKKAIGPAFKAALAIIGAVILGIVGLVTSLVAGIIKAVAKILPFVISAIQGLMTVFTGLADFLTAFWQILQGLFSGNMEQVTQGFQNMKDAISLIWEGMWLGIRSVFEGFWVGLEELLSTVIESIVGFFTNLRDRLIGGSIIPEMLAEMLTAFTTWFTEIADNLTVWVEERVAQFVAFFEDLKKEMGEFATERLTALTEFLTSIGTMVEDFVTERWKAFLKLLKEGTKKFEEIRKSFVDWIDDRLLDIDEAWGKIFKLFKDGWEDLKDLGMAKMSEMETNLRTFIANFKKIGEDIIGGIKDGIISKALEMADAAVQAILAALAAARAAIDAHSPSRHGKRLGENWGSAVATGMQESVAKQIPEIQKVATRATLAMTSVVRGGFMLRSPSKVMEQLGVNTVQGWLLGLKQMMPASQAMMGLITGSALAPTMRPARVPQSIDRSRTVNYNLTAQYRTAQSEARLIDDLSLLSAVTGGR